MYPGPVDQPGPDPWTVRDGSPRSTSSSPWVIVPSLLCNRSQPVVIHPNDYLLRRHRQDDSASHRCRFDSHHRQMNHVAGLDSRTAPSGATIKLASDFMKKGLQNSIITQISSGIDATPNRAPHSGISTTRPPGDRPQSTPIHRGTTTGTTMRTTNRNRIPDPKPETPNILTPLPNDPLGRPWPTTSQGNTCTMNRVKPATHTTRPAAAIRPLSAPDILLSPVNHSGYMVILLLSAWGFRRKSRHLMSLLAHTGRAFVQSVPYPCDDRLRR